MKVRLFHDKVLVLSGVGVEQGSEVEIELMGVKDPATIRINGLVYQMSDGKRRIPMRAFGEIHNDIKIHSGGKWHVLEGLVRKGSVLTMAEEVVVGTMSELVAEVDRMQEDIKTLSKKVEELMKKCSGDDFL